MSRPRFAEAAREAALEVLFRVEREGAFSHLALSGALRRLEGRDRALATELVYGTLTWRRRLDRALASFTSLSKTPPAALEAMRMAAYQLLFLDRVPAHAAINDAVTQVRRMLGQKVAGFVNAVLRKLSQNGEPPLPEGEDALSLSLRYSAPCWLVARRLRGASPEEVRARLAAEARPAPLTLRVNLKKTSVEALLEALGAGRVSLSPTEPDVLPEAQREPDKGAGLSLSRGVLSPEALRVRGFAELVSSRLFEEGLYTIQDEGAQAVSLALAPPVGARVLDACSGFGGKALHLASLVGPTGSVVALDIAEKKLETLRREARRLGISNIETRCEDLSRLEPRERFSYILLDAPCTGLGTLRRHPELRWRRQEEDIAKAAALQGELCEAAARLLSPGGVLVYAVCSPELEEGEEIIKNFLARHPGFVCEPIEAPSLARARGPEGFARTSPEEHDADCFFIARLRAGNGLPHC